MTAIDAQPLHFTDAELSATRAGLMKAYANLYRIYTKEMGNPHSSPGISAQGTIAMRKDYATELFYAETLTHILGTMNEPFTRVQAILFENRCHLVLHNDYARSPLPDPGRFAEMLANFDFTSSIKQTQFGNSFAYDILTNPEKRAGLFQPFAESTHAQKVGNAADRAEKAWGFRPRFA